MMLENRRGWKSPCQNGRSPLTIFHVKDGGVETAVSPGQFNMTCALR